MWCLYWGTGLRTPRNVFFVPLETCAHPRPQPTLGRRSGVNGGGGGGLSEDLGLWDDRNRF